MKNNKPRTLLYGAQTSLGHAYVQLNHGDVVGISAEGLNELRSAISEIEKKGPFNRLLCVDGINHLSHIGLTPDEDSDILKRNVFLPYMLVNELVQRKFKPMNCVFISSQTHRVAQRKTALYCASKAAMTHLVRVMARELASEGWFIKGLAPGKIVNTKMAQLTDAQVLQLRGWNQEQADDYALTQIPMGRFTDVNEVCQAIDWLFDAPGYVNGTTVDMTGGA
jgi:3-oxoacyl-[acyl-carrier protein] reductase